MIKLTYRKALEILEATLEGGPQYPSNDRREAVKVAIEALRSKLKPLKS